MSQPTHLKLRWLAAKWREAAAEQQRIADEHAGDAAGDLARGRALQLKDCAAELIALAWEVMP